MSTGVPGYQACTFVVAKRSALNFSDGAASECLSWLVARGYLVSVHEAEGNTLRFRHPVRVSVCTPVAYAAQEIWPILESVQFSVRRHRAAYITDVGMCGGRAQLLGAREPAPTRATGHAAPCSTPRLIEPG